MSADPKGQPSWKVLAIWASLFVLTYPLVWNGSWEWTKALAILVIMGGGSAFAGKMVQIEINKDASKKFMDVLYEFLETRKKREDSDKETGSNRALAEKNRNDDRQDDAE